jgi:hypothetical protein
VHSNLLLELIKEILMRKKQQEEKTMLGFLAQQLLYLDSTQLLVKELDE